MIVGERHIEIPYLAKNSHAWGRLSTRFPARWWSHKGSLTKKKVLDFRDAIVKLVVFEIFRGDGFGQLGWVSVGDRAQFLELLQES